jgi:hypothetical protein
MQHVKVFVKGNSDRNASLGRSDGESVHCSHVPTLLSGTRDRTGALQLCGVKPHGMSATAETRSATTLSSLTKKE